MARPLRIEAAGAWFDLTARGNERKPVFRDDADRRHFLQRLGGMSGRFAVSVAAYVCGLAVRELGRLAGGLDDRCVVSALGWFARWLRGDATLTKRIDRLNRHLQNNQT